MEIVIHKTQMPTEGTGTTNPTTLATMSIVTYRGVKYDTEARKAQDSRTQEFVEVYRGVKHIERKEVIK